MCNVYLEYVTTIKVIIIFGKENEHNRNNPESATVSSTQLTTLSYYTHTLHNRKTNQFRQHYERNELDTNFQNYNADQSRHLVIS